MRQAIQEVSEETLKIENILLKVNPGEKLTYKNLEIMTGVRMDNRGKSYLRSALRRLKMPYMTTSGIGIEILSNKNASAIVSNSVIKIDNSVKRAEKTVRQVRNRVYDDLNPNERKTIDVLGALFGSIRSFSSSAKQLFHKSAPKVGEIIYQKESA